MNAAQQVRKMLKTPIRNLIASEATTELIACLEDVSAGRRFNYYADLYGCEMIAHPSVAEGFDKRAKDALIYQREVRKLAMVVNRTFEKLKQDLTSQCHFITFMLSPKFTQNQALWIILEASRNNSTTYVRQLMAMPAEEIPQKGVLNLESDAIHLNLLNFHVIVSGVVTRTAQCRFQEIIRTAELAEEKVRPLKQCIQNLKTLPFLSTVTSLSDLSDHFTDFLRSNLIAFRKWYNHL